VNVEIEADAAGTLSEIVVPEGQSAPVGDPIAYINGRGAGSAPSAAAPAAAPAAPSAPTVPATPVAPAPAASGERIKASPIARRLAAERGVDLSRITGTGPGGRIVERDVEAAVAAPPTAAPPAQAPAAEYEDIELSRMRQAIARGVAHSKQTAPHFYVTVEVEMARAADVRAQLKEASADGAVIPSVNDLVLKATALALRARPELNATLAGPTTIRRFRRVHLGIMVAIPDGLVVPVLRDADRLPLLALGKEARRLADGARQRRLRQEEFTGATFSVSNLGMFGVASFAAIINPPEAGVLAVGRIEDRPVVRDGQIVVRPIMAVTVSIDHRVTDGVGAAAFLAELKRLLEHPVLLLDPAGGP